MKFIADLHVHSKYSRATARNLDLENLYIASQLKGITVVGTGDFTHPQWFSEIKSKLEPTGKGLFKLKEEISQRCDQQVPAACQGKVRFILESEISNIYKKEGQTRKNHNLVFVPDLDTAQKVIRKLDQIGNIRSDGRPILGLDARNLLEIILETSEKNFFVPAHIWTPWFSLLGSKSGFNSIGECFDDLAHYIFAAETGLSSDPPMNWRISDLDGVTLISNSDAHSPLKIGREANYFDTDLDFSSIKKALQTGNMEHFLGTFEFYPQEGKYHLDGHRKCNVRLWPRETMDLKGLCPVCGKKLTIGVLYRVEELADRPRGGRPEKRHPYYYILPLVDLLSEILQVGPNSKKVERAYRILLEKLGPELQILQFLPLETVNGAGIALLSEAIGKMRQGKIQIQPGYDGEFGRISIFKKEERKKILGQKTLFNMPSKRINATISQKRSAYTDVTQSDMPYPRKTGTRPKNSAADHKNAKRLNREQKHAVEYESGPMIIVAGPGTGKTHTITRRIAFLIQNEKIAPQHVLAVTFTNKAAQEMKSRLQDLLRRETALPLATTFHAFCLNILSEQSDGNNDTTSMIIEEAERRYFIADAVTTVKKKSKDFPNSHSARTVLEAIGGAKQRLLAPHASFDFFKRFTHPNELVAVYTAYQNLLVRQSRLDYEDLILNVVNLLEKDTTALKMYLDRFKYIFVDEYQDINYGQYRFIRLLSPPQKNLCVIGDPDQSIYGFRGSDAGYFKRFVSDYPGAEVIHLKQNFRSTQTILDVSFQIIQNGARENNRSLIYSDIDGIKKVSILENASHKSEAVAVGQTIEKMIGGTGFFSIDIGKIDDTETRPWVGFSDIAVLYRTHQQSEIFIKTFEDAGIPFQVASKKDTFDNQNSKEFISAIKIMDGVGSFFDLEQIKSFFEPRITQKMLRDFKSWCYVNHMVLNEGLKKAKQFPIPAMGRERQQRLLAFFKQIRKRARDTKGMKLDQKLDHMWESIMRKEDVSDNSVKRDNIGHLLSEAKGFKGSISDFVTRISLKTDTDTHVSAAEKVSLMTMHAAKGLEFPIVFIVGCEDGFLPYKRDAAEIPDVEEERRLFYVAMTRAKEQLFLSHAKKRRIYGRMIERSVSPFVRHIEKRFLKNEIQPIKKQSKRNFKQLKLF